MKQFAFIISLVTATILASCTKEQEDFFSTSSANRADASISNSIQALISPANGWLMQYYPDGQQSYGGFNMIARFTDDGKVQVMSEFSEGETYTSLYTVAQSAGTTLTFDTYNEAFHAFSDPTAPLGGSVGVGLNGDYDFSVMAASAQEIVLKGKKTGNTIVMTPMASSDWKGYLDQVAEIDEAMYAKKYSFNIAGETIVGKSNARHITLSYEENGEEVEANTSYIITPEGMTFYEPLEIKGQTISGFRYVANAETFPATDNANVTVTLIFPTLGEQLVEGLWFTSFSNLGSFGQTYWGFCNQNVMPIINGAGYPGTLDYFFFGTDGGEFGIFYNIIGYWGLNGVDVDYLADDVVSLTYNPKKNAYNADVFTSSGFLNVAAYLIAPLCADQRGNPVTRTFKITSDNPKNPGWLLLTDMENPGNTIRMLADEIYGNLFEK